MRRLSKRRAYGPVPRPFLGRAHQTAPVWVSDNCARTSDAQKGWKKCLQGADSRRGTGLASIATDGRSGEHGTDDGEMTARAVRTTCPYCGVGCGVLAQP